MISGFFLNTECFLKKLLYKFKVVRLKTIADGCITQNDGCDSVLKKKIHYVSLLVFGSDVKESKTCHLS